MRRCQAVGVLHTHLVGGVRQEPGFAPKKRNRLYRQFTNALELALVTKKLVYFLKKVKSRF